MDFSHNEYLFDEIKKGNDKAFEFLYKRYFYRLRGYAMRFIQDEEIIKDIIQECFTALWEKRKRLINTSLTSLLFVMVRNSCLNHLKRHATVKSLPIKETDISESEERLYYIDFGLDPSQKLLYEELEEQLELVLNNLTARCKEVFIMSRNEGLKNREIAEKLKISTTAVEKHIRNALGSFTFHLKEKYPVDVTYLILLFSILPF